MAQLRNPWTLVAGLIILCSWGGGAFAQTPSAEDQPLTEITDEQSPVFPLGRMTRPNLIIRSAENPDLSVSLGIRFQGTAEIQDQVGSEAPVFDAYARRLRFEVSTQFSKNNSFVLDLRNDNANREDSGEREFNVGDAYFVSKNLLGLPFLNLKAFRAKVDVSRTQTARSSKLVFYNRPAVSDEAANYVSQNRRAMNLQLFGDLDQKISYSIAVGDGIHSEDFEDAQGNTAQSIIRQNPMFGGKLILSPFEGWEEKERSETYFGVGKHFQVGAGFFRTGNIRFTRTGSSNEESVNHNLLNLEASAHYQGLFVQAEYFHFDDVVENFQSAPLNFGSSKGWYVVSELLFPQLGYFAPFARYEHWDRFEGKERYLQISRAAGVNWYLRGYTTRVGIAVQENELGRELGDSETLYQLTSQLHF